MIYVVKCLVSLFRFNDLFIFSITMQSRLRFNLKMSFLFWLSFLESNTRTEMEIIRLVKSVGWMEKHLCPWTKIGLFTLEFTLQCCTETLQ